VGPKSSTDGSTWRMIGGIIPGS